jgi:hypothetical protein
MEAVAARLAGLLSRKGSPEDEPVVDPAGSRLEIEGPIELRHLEKGPVPPEVWAVDGGQALVADARSVSVLLTRASRVCLRDGRTAVEDEGKLRAHLLGGAEDRRALASLGLDLPASTSVDIGLLRERWEWDAVARCVEEARAGALVLVDGDLLPDPRIPPRLVEDILGEARRRQVVVAGVTKHSGLSRGGAPLILQLELDASATLGERARWWAALGRTRQPESGPGGPVELQVLAARLDPSAPFAFRVDVPAPVEAPDLLGALASVSDDAGFPGYPYPLAVADRLAGCPGWLREESRLELDELLERAGIAGETRERAFADRHDLMERV